MMKGQKGKLSKRMTDSSFEIIGYARKKYLIEEQTRPDTSILIRIFEYSMLLAGSTGSVEDNMLTVSLPNCAVLFLRSSRNVPDKMKMKLEAPLGELLIDVLVMRLQDYTLEDMFRKDLLILFPFYLFRFSNSRLAECDQDEEQLETITSDYSRMQEHLTCLTDSGKLSEFERYTILFLCNKVVESLAGKYENVLKGVQSVMGGKVIETDAKKILNQGKLEERANTERERCRADAAEQKASMLQKELDVVKQQLRDLLQAQGPKLAEQ
ncbi:MAG: hypothetical protein LUI39_08835, partial [Lachnospiraceae bacterium]|nr:hypothetical protein [Lachnospiraceae bacterium]